MLRITEVDASVDCTEELGAAEREHVGLQERLVGSIGGHVHNPSSAVRTLQRHRLAPEEEIVSIDLHHLGPTDQMDLDSRPDRGRSARGRLVGPHRAAP